MRLRRWVPLLVLVLVFSLVAPVLPAGLGDVPPAAPVTLPVPLPGGAVATALGALAADGSGQFSLGTLPEGDYNVLVQIPGGDPVGYRVVDDARAAVQVSPTGGGPSFVLRAGEAVWQHVQVKAGGALTLNLQGGPGAGRLNLIASALPVAAIDGSEFTGLAPYAGHKSTVAVQVDQAGFYDFTLYVGGNVLTIEAAGTRLNAVVADEQSPDVIYLPAGLQEISFTQIGGGRPWRIGLSGPKVTALPLIFDSQLRETMPASLEVNLGNRLGPVRARVTLIALGLAGTRVQVEGGPVSLNAPIGADGRLISSQLVSFAPGETVRVQMQIALADYVRQVCGPDCGQRLEHFAVILVDNAESYLPPVTPDLPVPLENNPETGAPNNGWYYGDVSLAWKGSTEALARTELSGDGVEWFPYDPLDWPIPLTEDGVYSLYWRTAGLKGNGELPNLVTVRISKAPPASQVELSSTAPQNDDGSYSGPVTVTFHTFTAPASLADGAELFSLDRFRSSGYDVAEPLTFWTPGKYTLTVRALDDAGSVEEPYQVSFTIAGDPPPGGGSYVLTTTGDISAARVATLHKMLERAWEQNTNVLGFTPTTPIMVQFIENRERWNWQLLADGFRLSTVSIVNGAGGISMFGGHHIEIPLDHDPTMEPADGAADDGDLQNTISHEIFHAILGRSGDDANVPTWGNEGTAWQIGNLGQLPFSGGGQPYAAASFLSARNIILNANKYGGFVPLSDIDVLASFWNTEAYSYLAIARLQQRYGTARWIQYIRTAAAGHPNALEETLGISQAEIDADLHRWVAQQSTLAPGVGRLMLRLQPELGPASLGFTAAGQGKGGVQTELLQPGDYTFYVQQDGTVWGPADTRFRAAEETRDFDRLTVTVTPKDLEYRGKRLSNLSFYLRQSFGQWYVARYRLFFDDGTALAGPFIAGADLAGLVRLLWVDTLDAGTLQPRDADVIALGLTGAAPAPDLRAFLRLDSDRLEAGRDGTAILSGVTHPGAAVWISGLGLATKADATGRFSLTVPVDTPRRVLVHAGLSVPVSPAVVAVELQPHPSR